MSSKSPGASKRTVEYLTSIGALFGFVGGMFFDQVLVGLLVGVVAGALLGLLLRARR